MKWKKFENNVVVDMEQEEYVAMMKTINNPSAMHSYKDCYVINPTNQTYTANDVEMIVQQLIQEYDN